MSEPPRDEEEPGATAPAPQPTPGRRKVFAGLNMPAKVADQFTARTGLELVLREGENFHPHPVLAVARSVLERKAVKFALAVHHECSGESVLYSIAPNMNREARLYPAGFTRSQRFAALTPMILPGDGNRIASARKHVERTYIQTFEEHTPPAPVSTFLSVHTLYYLPPRVLADWLIRSESHTSFHVVNTHVGAFGERPFGEGHWYLNDDGTVTERVKGNAHSYFHPPLTWVHRGGLEVAPGVALTVKVHEQIFDTMFIEVSLENTRAFSPKPGPNTLASFATGSYSSEDAAWVDVTQNDHALVRARVRRFKILGEAAVLDVGEVNREVIVDRRVISTVASILAGLPRTSDTERDAMFYSRRELNKAGFLDVCPHMEFERVVTYTAVIAQVRNLAEMTDVRLDMQRVFGPAMRIYNAALSWGPVVRVHWGTVAGAVFCMAALVPVLYFFVPVEHHALAYSMLALLLLLCAVFYYCVYIRNLHEADVGRSWVRWAQFGQPLGFQEPLTLTDPLLRGHRTLVNVDPEDLRETDGVTTFIRVGPDPKPPAHPSVDQPRSEVVGIQPVDVVPLVIEPTQEAELAGVKARIMRKVPIATPEAIDDLVDALESDPKLQPLRDIVGPPPRDVVDRWLDRCPTQGERRRMEATLLDLKRRQLDEDDFYKNAFLKLEKTRKTVEREKGVLEAKPRIIQALSDRLKAFISPSVWWVAQTIKRLFDGLSGLLFASGRNAETIGAFFWTAYHEIPNPVFFRDDFSTYDASCGLAFRTVWGAAMRWADVDQEVQDAVEHSRPKGLTPHGVSYSTEDGLCSGAPETSDGGSLFNGAAACVAFHRLGLSPDDWRMAVLGDDGAGVFSWTPVLQARYGTDYAAFAADLNREYLRLGLMSDVVCFDALAHFEFASYRLYPISTPRGVTWKMGPKPGRAITKLATKRTDSRTSNLAADVASLYQDGAHVPFLRVVLQRYRTLLKGQRAKGKPEGEDYKIHAGCVSTFDPSGWADIHLRYGLGPEDEADLERALARVSRLPCTLEHRVLTRLVEVDF